MWVKDGVGLLFVRWLQRYRLVLHSTTLFLQGISQKSALRHEICKGFGSAGSVACVCRADAPGRAAAAGRRRYRRRRPAASTHRVPPLTCRLSPPRAANIASDHYHTIHECWHQAQSLLSGACNKRSHDWKEADGPSSSLQPSHRSL